MPEQRETTDILSWRYVALSTVLVSGLLSLLLRRRLRWHLTGKVA